MSALRKGKLMNFQRIAREQEKRNTRTIKLLVIEDHPIVRLGIEMLFEYLEDIFIVGETASVYEALQLIPALNPDVVLMDAELPSASCTHAIAQIKDRFPEITIVALSFNEDHIYREELLSSGVHDLISKRTAPWELVRAIRTAAHAIPA
jgi:DNA-binding NarL/FixJ family response regulator